MLYLGKARRMNSFNHFKGESLFETRAWLNLYLKAPLHNTAPKLLCIFFFLPPHRVTSHPFDSLAFEKELCSPYEDIKWKHFRIGCERVQTYSPFASILNKHVFSPPPPPSPRIKCSFQLVKDPLWPLHPPSSRVHFLPTICRAYDFIAASMHSNSCKYSERGGSTCTSHCVNAL